jgi:predicted CopG family antitoxin
MKKQSDYKTITVTFDTWKGLTNIKYEMLFKDLDGVIKHLLKIKKENKNAI